MTQEPQNSASAYRGYAAAFQDKSVVEAYHYRPLYPAETFDILTSLIQQEPRYCKNKTFSKKSISA